MKNIVLVLSILNSFYLFGQTDSSWTQEKVVTCENREDEKEIVRPSYYSTINIGWMELYSLSIGKYLNNNITVAVKFSMFGVAGGGAFGPNASGGYGLGINYFYKKLLIFQYLSADYLILDKGGYKGYGVEVVVGNCTNRESGFGFVYEFGFGYSNVIAEFSIPQYQRIKLLGPIIKFGLNYNL